VSPGLAVKWVNPNSIPTFLLLRFLPLRLSHLSLSLPIHVPLLLPFPLGVSQFAPFFLTGTFPLQGPSPLDPLPFVSSPLGENLPPSRPVATLKGSGLSRSGTRNFHPTILELELP
jgi:hypothetical protein